MEQTNEKLGMKEKLAFGAGDMASNILFATINFYFLYFMINVGGLRAEYASAVFLIGKGWDAITDYLMGRIVDKTQSKFGKRKVYMLFGAVPFIISFILMWMVPGTNIQAIKMVFYTAMYILYCTTWTIIYIPYNTLAPNMTKDYDERTSLNSIRIIMANLGLILGAAVFSLLADGGESILCQAFMVKYPDVIEAEKYAFITAAAIFGAVALVVWLLCCFGVKERFDYSEDNDKSFIQTLKEFFKLKEFRNIMMTFLLSMMGFDIIMTVFVFYINDALGFGASDNEMLSMIFIAIPLICAIFSAPLWDFLCKKFQKHVVYAFSCVYMTAVLLLAIFMPQNNIPLTIVHVALCGIGMSAIQIIPWAALPDVVDVDEYVNGKRREGAYYGVTQFCYKFASGVGCALVSLILGAAGYIEANSAEYEAIKQSVEAAGETFKYIVQPDSALLAIRIVLSVIPGIIFLASAVTSYRANLGRDRYNMIKEELAKKHGDNAMNDTQYLTSQPKVMEKIKDGEKEDINQMEKYNPKDSF